MTRARAFRALRARAVLVAVGIGLALLLTEGIGRLFGHLPTRPSSTYVTLTRHPAHFDLTRAHFRVRSIARVQGVPLLDLTPAFVQFRQADPRRRPLFFAHDKHFTPLGHCLTASLVAQWLVPTGRSAPLDACR